MSNKFLTMNKLNFNIFLYMCDVSNHEKWGPMNTQTKNAKIYIHFYLKKKKQALSFEIWCFRLPV